MDDLTHIIVACSRLSGLFQLTQSLIRKLTPTIDKIVVTLFKAKVISRVNMEYQFARFRNTVCNIIEKWNAYNVLCKVENDNIVFNL